MLAYSREITLFGKQQSFSDFQKSYSEKLSQLQTLIGKLTPKEEQNPTQKLSQDKFYRMNPVTNQWETEEERKQREFNAAEDLRALFNQQAKLEGNEKELKEFSRSIQSEVNNVLVHHQLKAPHSNPEITNEDLLNALRQLVPSLEMPRNITQKQAEVAIEVMDLVINALYAHSGKNGTKDSKKPLSKEEMIQKLTSLGKELENNGFTGTIPMILGILLCVASLLTLSVLLGCLIVPTLGPAACTMLGIAATENTAVTLYTLSMSAILVGILTIFIGGVAIPMETASPNSNPAAAKAILDLAKSWDLEPAHVTTPAFSG